MATLTYVYTDSTAVLGPLALRADPHGYDLCLPHATSLSVPRGWEVIRLALDGGERVLGLCGLTDVGPGVALGTRQGAVKRVQPELLGKEAWEVIRLALEADPGPSPDDLLALADAVREVGFAYDQLESEPSEPRSGPGPGGHGNSIVELGRRGHLTVLADPDS